MSADLTDGRTIKENRSLVIFRYKSNRSRKIFSELWSWISFNVAGLHPYDVGTILDQLGIAVRTGHHCTQPIMDFYGIPGTIRASFSFYNNLEDVAALKAGLEKAISMLK